MHRVREEKGGYDEYVHFLVCTSKKALTQRGIPEMVDLLKAFMAGGEAEGMAFL